ncbi:uncharacterized protein LOC121425510 [Lytechinus variegatus]|uniref:uncharacterized protein LOC121425510 n=1 Tax=Lytechinus variegatus TaxID=7654 RepID=UPI001BB20149|nr:uncharacterized protein LOC121425510 [Lytechinus variegatus]
MTAVMPSQAQDYGSLQSDGRKPLKVSVCTSATATNVQGFIDELPIKFSDLDLDVRHFELPYNDIDHFEFKSSDVGTMILCHSINNRRFAITDVMDALYDRFLPYSAKKLGRERVCVIAHDFPPSKDLDKPDKYQKEMEDFRRRQGTAFQNSALTMMCGKLDGPVEMQQSNWDDLKTFLVNAATPIKKKPWWSLHKGKLAILVLIALIALAVGLGVAFSTGSPPTSTTPTPPPTSTTATPTPPGPTSTIPSTISSDTTTEIPNISSTANTTYM